MNKKSAKTFYSNTSVLVYEQKRNVFYWGVAARSSEYVYASSALWRISHRLCRHRCSDVGRAWFAVCSGERCRQPCRTRTAHCSQQRSHSRPSDDRYGSPPLSLEDRCTYEWASQTKPPSQNHIRSWRLQFHSYLRLSSHCNMTRAHCVMVQ